MIQCMYMARNPNLYHEQYFDIVKEIQHAAQNFLFYF